MEDRPRPAATSEAVPLEEAARAAILRARHSRENVLHSSGVGIACANASGILDLRAEPQVAELRDQVVAHAIMLRTTNRMWPLRDREHMLHCSLG